MTAAVRVLQVEGIPTEPPRGAVVIDVDGLAWQRGRSGGIFGPVAVDGYHWIAARVGDPAYRCRWIDLLARGAVTLVWEPTPANDPPGEKP